MESKKCDISEVIMKRKRLLSIVLTGIMVFSFIGCNSGKPGKIVDITYDLPEVNWGEGLFDGKTLIDDHFEEDEEFVWETYANEGVFTMAREDGKMVANIENAGTLDYSCQLYRDGFELNQDGVYEASFTIACDIERPMQWRFQLNGGDYHAYYIEDYVPIGPQTRRITATFTMEEETDPAPRFCFNLGIFNDMENVPHKVYIDDFNLTLLDSSNAKAAPEEEAPNAIKVNQVGYKTTDNKKVVLTSKDYIESFDIVNVETEEVVFTGSFDEKATISKNGDGKTFMGDFTEFAEEGRYYISVEGFDPSYTFAIADDVFDDITKATVRMLYLQRCGCEIPADAAGAFAHGACHNTNAKIYGTNDYIDVTGGWHDAGDYGRYVVAGSKTVADLFLTYEDCEASHGDDYDIPESGNGVPDILDEARYELEWMLKMQASNGGVYHKVSCAVFPGTVMPDEETDELIVSPVSVTATADFAAIMAKASKIYKEYDAAFAQKCMDAALKAYAYTEANAAADTGFVNPADIVTGEYPDDQNTDEYLWASVELYLVTGDSKYQSKTRDLVNQTFKAGLGWADMGDYAMYDYLKAKGYVETPVEITTPDNSAPGPDDVKAYYDSLSDEEFIKIKFSEKMKLFAESALDYSTTDSYFSSMRIYPWGSNMTIANNGILYVMMYNLTGKEIYDEYARYQIDYLLGVNAVAYSYVTGYGDNAAANPHHRPSQAVGSAMPGMLVGGPNTSPADPVATKVLAKKVGGSCYVDNDAAYSINEITIYWNSPLIYLLERYK